MSRSPRSSRALVIRKHLGRRLAQRREELGLTRETLDDRIGDSRGDVAKFEHGAKTAGAVQLYRLGQALEVPVDYFFEGLPRAVDGEAADALNAADVLEAKDLLKEYYEITDREVRRNIQGLVRAQAESDMASTDET